MGRGQMSRELLLGLKLSAMRQALHSLGNSSICLSSLEIAQQLLTDGRHFVEDMDVHRFVDERAIVDSRMAIFLKERHRVVVRRYASTRLLVQVTTPKKTQLLITSLNINPHGSAMEPLFLPT